MTKLKKDRILEIADIIENGREDIYFNMETYGDGMDGMYIRDTDPEPAPTCGTVACIAGWVVARYGVSGRAQKFDARRAEDVSIDHHEVARRALGLSPDQASHLFLPNTLPDPIDSLLDVPPEAAVQALRKLAATGEVDWSHAV